MKTIRFFILSALFVLSFSTVQAAGNLTKVCVSKSEAMKTISSYKAKGYMPIWIDGFNHSTAVATNRGTIKTLFNLIFVKNSAKLPVVALIGMDGATYQKRFDYYVKTKKMRLEFVESYKEGNTIRYAAIWVKKSGPAFLAYHGIPKAKHQQKFDDLVKKGYRMKCRTTVIKNGNAFVTALYDKAKVGSWLAKNCQTAVQAQAIMMQNKAKGRTLTHFDIVQTTPAKISFGMIFNSLPNKGWYATNNLSLTQLNQAIAKAKSNGYQPTIISGFDKAGLVNGNEVNKIRFAVAFVKPAQINALVAKKFK